MRKVLVLVLTFLAITSLAIANSGNSNKNDNENEATAIADALAAQQQGQIGINKNENININNLKNKQNQDQKQLQGQLQGQKQGQIANGNVETTVTGDETKTKVYANSWPSLSGGIGVSQANAYSIFGGLGVSNTEEYKVCIEKLMVIDTLVKLEYMTKEEAKAEITLILNDLKYNTSTKRFLGILWKTSGRNLLNGVGLLSWDSFWKEGKTPADYLTTKKTVTADKEIVGNRGNVNE